MNRIRSALLAVPLALAACGGDGASTGPRNPAPPASTPNDIGIFVGASQFTTTAFSPNPKVVALGGNPSVAVRWVNKDITGGNYAEGSATIHNITSDAGTFAASGGLGGNGTHSVSLTTAGDYPYHCAIHTTMVGTITVGP